MSAIQVTINGVPDQVVTAYMTSLPILSSGLDQNANTTLNNVDVQNYPDGGNIKIGDSAMNSKVNNPLTNIAIGYNALPVVDGSTLNSDNIAIGQDSLLNVTTGGKNIGIGLSALSGLTTQTNTIGIGNNTSASVSNGIIIGNNINLTNNNSGMIKFDAITTNTVYPASNEFWFGDSSTGWVDVKAGDVFVDNLDVSGALTTGSLSLDSLQVTSDTGYIDVFVRNSGYNNTLNKIDEIQNTASFRNKYGPIAFIADVSGVLSSATDPILREKILFGYQQGTKAVEINAYGAISLDSVNSGNPLPALTSNYGTNGQVLISQGSATNAKWSSITDISGVIGLNNRNIRGITYVRDASGNLDSSSNFVYDGSGVNVVANKNSQLYGLQIQNTSTGVSASSDLTLKNSTNTAIIELKSTGYTAGTTIDSLANMLSISNPSNSININSGNKTLIGYSSNNRAFEITSTGAMSFDTSNNSGTFVSNYGTVGQVLISQGSTLPPKWGASGAGSSGIIVANPIITGISYVIDVSGNLDTNSNFIYDGSGINISASKNSKLYGLQIQNTSAGVAASSDLTLKNSTNTATLELKSTGYTAGTTIDAKSNILSLSNPSNPININSGDKTLISYSSNTKAIEIASSGAMSFDTSNNSGTFVSNYGISGQILSSQGSSSPPKWSTISDISGFITTYNKNVNGIAYVRDSSGNLDSSSNFVYDGSGITIASTKNSQLNGLTIQNTNTGNSAKTNINLLNDFSTSTLEYKSYNYTPGTTIDAKGNMLTIGNNVPTGSININAGDKTLLGYSSNTKAFEIASSGAMSFDTSNNSGTFVSNYGTSGQILSSQGSSAPPKWITNTGGGGITMANANINGIGYVKDASGNLDSNTNLTWNNGIFTTNYPNLTNSQHTFANITSNDYGSKTLGQIKLGLNYGPIGYIDFVSSVYNNLNYTVDQARKTMSIYNYDGNLLLYSGNSNKILFGYSFNNKAIEINPNGAMSFDTSGNNTTPLSFTSNYGVSGEQILISRGSNAPPRWGRITDVSGGITVFNKNIGGIPFIIDSSGNLDSSANFIYDGSGIYIKSQKFGDYYGMTIENTTTAGNASTTQIKLIGYSNSGLIDLKGSIFQQYNNRIDQTVNNLSLKSPNGDISLMPGYASINGGKILLGYNEGYKAIEINRYGALSFDSSGNNDLNLTFTSNYGVSGEQIMISRGSNAPPRWGRITDVSGGISGFPKIISIQMNNYGTTYTDSSNNLFSYNISSGLTSGKTRIITFTTGVNTSTIGSVTFYTYTLFINGTSIQSYNVKKPNTNLSQLHTITFSYSNSNTTETVLIKLDTGDGALNIGTSDYYSFRMEEIQ